MSVKADDFLIVAWKQQLDTGLRLMEAAIEAAIRLHEAQLEAATEAHADAVATRKAIAAARDAAEVLRLQSEWTRANIDRCLACWRSMAEAAMQTGR